MGESLERKSFGPIDPAPESTGTQPEQPYSQEDIERWKDGARKWHDFWEEIEPKTTWRNTEELQAMFLGEKPAVLKNYLANECKEDLQRYEYKKEGDYFYDTELAQQAMDNNQDIMESYQVSTPAQAFQKLDKAELTEMNDLRGVLLGIPRESVDGHSKANKLKINNIAEELHNLPSLDDEDRNFLIDQFHGNQADKQGIKDFFRQQLSDHAEELNIRHEEIPELLKELSFKLAGKGVKIHDVKWVDYGDYPESKAKQERLKKAFKVSSVLQASKSTK